MKTEMTTAAEQSVRTASERVQEMSETERCALLVKFLEESETKADPYRWQRAYDTKMKGDEEYMRKKKAVTLAWQNKKYKEDEEYREKRKARQKEYYRANKTRKLANVSQ